MKCLNPSTDYFPNERRKVCRISGHLNVPNWSKWMVVTCFWFLIPLNPGKQQAICNNARKTQRLTFVWCVQSIAIKILTASKKYRYWKMEWEWKKRVRPSSTQSNCERPPQRKSTVLTMYPMYGCHPNHFPFIQFQSDPNYLTHFAWARIGGLCAFHFSHRSLWSAGSSVLS